MKKNFLKVLTSLILVISLTGAIVLTAACNKKDNQGGNEGSVNVSAPNSGSGSSGGDGGNGGSGGNGDGGKTAPSKVVRDDLDKETVKAEIMGMTLKDLFLLVTGEDKSLLEGRYVGDLINAAITSIDVGAPANLDNLCYDLYDNGKWVARRNNKEIHSVLNAFFNYKLDGSEPLALTLSDINNYGSSSILDLTDLADNKLIYPFIEASPVLSRVFGAKVSVVAGLFDKDPSVAAESLITLVGDRTLGEVAEALDMGELPDYFAQKTVGELVELIEYSGISDSAKILLMGYAMDLLAQYGEIEVAGIATVNDLFGALSGNDKEALSVYAENGYDALIALLSGLTENEYYQIVKDKLVTKDETVDDVVQKLLSVSYDDAFKELSALYENISEDGSYINAIISELSQDALAEAEELLAIYGEEEICGVTINDIVSFIGDPESEDNAEVYTALIALADAYTAKYFDGATAKELYEKYEDEVVYGEYTVGEIVEGVFAAESPEQVLAEVMVEINRLSSDLGYALSVVAPYIGKYGDLPVFVNGDTTRTIGELYTLAQFYASDPETAVALLKIMPVSVIATFFGVEDLDFEFPSESINDLYKEIIGLDIGEVSGEKLVSVFEKYYSTITVADFCESVSELTSAFAGGMDYNDFDDEVCDNEDDHDPSDNYFVDGFVG